MAVLSPVDRVGSTLFRRLRRMEGILGCICRCCPGPPAAANANELPYSSPTESTSTTLSSWQVEDYIIKCLSPDRIAAEQ